jgi:hypothetical protein
VVTTLCASVGIQTAINNSQFEIYPNPVKDELIVRSSVFGENKNTQLKIVDVYGKEILSQKLNTPNTELKTPDLKQGIYFVKITTDTGYVVKKFVKE